MPRPSLTTAMLLALAGGIAFGYLLPDWAERIEVVSRLFLRLIQSIIAPVLVGVLIRAIGNAGSMANLGRLGWKSVLYFEIATTSALILGWFTSIVAQPGVGLTLPAGDTPVSEPLGFTAALEQAVPTSIIDALARGDVVQIVLFCLLFGVACLAIGEKAKPIIGLADSLAEVALKYTEYVMWLAPPAVFAAAANTVATSPGALQGLARFTAAAWVAQALFLAAILLTLIPFRVNLTQFLRHIRKPFLIGFSTTSSAAALPQTLESMAEFGVPPRILGVVTPLSISLNLNGSTIHLAMATVFVAQAAGIALTWEQQLLMLLTLKITSKGVAGIPRANFVILTALFTSFGLPLSGLAVLLGIDALIDPIRTSTNVLSHCAAPAAIAQWERETPPST